MNKNNTARTVSNFLMHIYNFGDEPDFVKIAQASTLEAEKDYIGLMQMLEPIRKQIEEWQEDLIRMDSPLR
jgi:hypothetical protein